MAARPKANVRAFVATLIALGLLIPLVMISPWILSIVLIVLCGIYVSFEFALVQVSMRELEKDAETGVSGASTLVVMKREINAMLAACQFGITLTSLGLTLALEPALHHAFADSGLTALADASGPLALAIGAFFHVTFGELVPKGVALVVPVKVLYVTAPFMRIFRFAAVPFIKSCNAIANVIVKTLTGKNPDTDAHDGHHVEVGEALLMANAEGRIGRRQLQIMKNVLAFADRTAREVMTPARLVVSLDAKLSWEDNFKIAEDNGFSRFPVLGADAHELIGYVRRAELLKAELQGTRDLAALLRPIERRPETAPLMLLNLFKGTPMVACYDEHDSFSGLLTAEDVIEQIVGEVYDETDDLQAPSIQRRPDGSVKVDGALLLEQAGEALGLGTLVDDHQDVDTIGGLVLKTLARQPARGDHVDIGDWTAQVDSAQGFRILSLTFVPRPPQATAGEDTPSG
jgi:CBS domain containing-hemolysin-like protein